jgi:hypothetical protein
MYPDLEKMLPSELGGEPLAKVSWPLDLLLRSTKTGDAKLYEAWTSALGADPLAVRFATATNYADRKVLVSALQVPGDSTDRLKAAFKQAATAVDWPLQEETIVGKPVMRVADTTASDPNNAIAYAYAKGDTLFVVVTDDASILAEALLKLP